MPYDPGPEPTPPEAPKKRPPTRPKLLLLLALLVCATSTQAALIKYLIVNPGTACPIGYICVPRATTQQVVDGPDGFPPGGNSVTLGTGPLVPTTQPMFSAVEWFVLRDDGSIVPRTIVDDSNPFRHRRTTTRRITDDSDPWSTAESQEVVRDLPAVLPWFCYDNSADCGTFGEEYCTHRGGVDLQVYTRGAEVPCSVRCTNGESGTCQEPPPNIAPPKPPPDPQALTQGDGVKP